MRARTYRLSIPLMAEFFTEGKRHNILIQQGIPVGAVMIANGLDYDNTGDMNTMYMVMEHPSFDEVSPTMEPPEFKIIVTSLPA